MILHGSKVALAGGDFVLCTEEEREVSRGEFCWDGSQVVPTLEYSSTLSVQESFSFLHATTKILFYIIGVRRCRNSLLASNFDEFRRPSPPIAPMAMLISGAIFRRVEPRAGALPSWDSHFARDSGPIQTGHSDHPWRTISPARSATGGTVRK